MLIDEINRAKDHFEVLSFPNCSYEQIQNAEEMLGFVLPQELSELCTMANGMSFGGVELFGILEKDHYRNLVSQSIRLRDEQGLPKHFLLLRSNGDGTYAAIHVFDDELGKFQVVLWDRSENLSNRAPYILSSSILEYLKSLIDEEIDFWDGEE